MKKLIILISLFLFKFSFCQTNKDRITIEYNAITKKDVLSKIESITDYKFFYIDKWLNNDTVLVSGNFKNADINDVLHHLFTDSNFNFYIEKKRIIITNSSIIYDKLPENYFETKNLEKTETDSNEIIEKPVFYQQYDSINDLNKKQKNNISLIGKESREKKQKLCTLSGHIINAKNGEPLSDIILRVKNKKIIAITNKEGYYSMQLPIGLNTIESTSSNYSKILKKAMIYSDGILDFSIAEKITQLDEINVKGKKQAIRTAEIGVSTLSAEGIKNIPVVFGERDLLKAATTLPGIKTAGEGSAGFNVRGGKEDQNLMLLDDAVLYNPSHFFGFFSALNPYTTQKVDIYKGSIPAEFGGRLSSVFDIKTKEGNYEKTSGEGGIGPATSNLYITSPIIKNKMNVVLGGRATYSEWILKSLKNEELKNSQASFYDGIIKFNYKINNTDSFFGSYYQSHDAFSISSDSIFKYNNRLISTNWKHTINKKNDISFTYTNSDYNFQIDYDNGRSNSFDFGYKINENNFIVKVNYAFNTKHKINYGFSSKIYNINPGHLTPKYPNSLLFPIDIEKEKGIESAAFISDNFTINKKLLLNIGIRYSHYLSLGGPTTQNIYENNSPQNEATVTDIINYEKNKIIKTYGGFEPRFAARYFLTQNISIKAGYDKTYQYIHLLSSNTTQSPTDTWKLADKYVKPQNAQQFSVGIYNNLLNDNLELSLESYYKTTKNILDYKVGAQILLTQNIETQLLQGEGKAYGLEFLLKKQSGKLNGWFGYTYSRTYIKLDSQFNEEKINNGKYFSANFDKPHDLSIVLNYKFTKRYSLSSNFIYQTGRPITYPIGSYTYNNAQYTLYSNRNEFRIPDYYRWDLGINIEGNHKIKKLAHSFLTISVYNVLGRNNPYSIYFITTEGKIKAYKTSIFAIPIPTITYNFKF